MIQRIQSIFLLLASSSLGSLFVNNMSFADFTEPDPSVAASADGFLNIYDDKIMVGIASLAILLGLICIFLYKKRPIQILLAWAMIGTTFLILGDAFLQIKTIGAIVVLKITGLGFIPIILTVIFAFLAIRYIRKDELLVRSADRLR